MARDVLALIERERLDRPFVVGHSMGGKTAMTLALEAPDAVAGVAVIDIAPERYGDQFSPYMTAMRGLDLAAALGRQEASAALARGLDGDAPMDFLLPKAWRHDERFDWRLNLLAVAMCMQDLCEFQQPSRRRYEGPALFMAGAYSDYVRPESHVGIARMFPQARVHTIPHAGHWVHADQPEALLLTLRDWLEEAGPPSSAWPPASSPASAARAR